jgi:hypothetical protein
MCRMSERTTKITCEARESGWHGGPPRENLRLIRVQRLGQQMESLFDSVFAKRLLLGDEA